MNLQGADKPPVEPRETPSFQKDDRWQLVLRVAASGEFCKSARLRHFLLYVCEKTLTDSLQDTHEQQIGLEVFDRRPGYNPGEDNIVRVEARELRRRLDRYFESEGADEPIRIRIPKGSYAPVFEARERVVPSSPDQINQLESSVSQPLSSQEKVRRVTVWQKFAAAKLPWAMVSWALLIALFSFCLGLFVEVLHSGRVTEQNSSQVDAKADKGTPFSAWPSLFDPQHPLIIVVSDASLVLAQSLARQLVPLEDYSNGGYLRNLPS